MLSAKLYAGLLFATVAGACQKGPTDPANSTIKTTRVTPPIVVDQFGYLPHAAKTAVIRAPQEGYDAEANAHQYDYSKLATQEYCLFNAAKPQGQLCKPATPWNEGATDPSSGDQAWWFDFSTANTPGSYYVASKDRSLRSATFEISGDIYRPVLTQAMRVFFYQRAGQEKKPPFADERWQDDASHLGPHQDSQARRFMAKMDANTTKDLSGGWYDAGDYNKYTNWTADYILGLLQTYRQSPTQWQDSLDIPESGNGVEDILDEVLWGLAWLEKMQLEDGAMLSILALDSTSPPSASKGPSFYGDPNTSATLTSAGTFALAAHVFKNHPKLKHLSEGFKQRAFKAWQWAEAHPNVIFKNNDKEFNTLGLGAGQQEVADKFRLTKRYSAAVHLFELTGEKRFDDAIKALYQRGSLFNIFALHPYSSYEYDAHITYCHLKNADTDVCAAIKEQFLIHLNHNRKRYTQQNTSDPYQAHLREHVWGSNSVKARMGWLLLTLGEWLNDPAAIRAAEGYIHYLHGVNPQGLVYLSNMAEFGAEQSVSEFYHAWFSHDSPKWNKVTSTTPGPAPGYVVGGPNPHYKLAECCPNQCKANKGATKEVKLHCKKHFPPLGQPAQKSYLEFNDTWPINSWQITENSNKYQVDYIRLLAQYVK